MFDNLRDDANSVPFYEDEVQFQEAEERKPAAKPPRKVSYSFESGRFLGMTAMQRFIIAFLLLISVCVLGSMCLLVTGRVGLF